jgi:predicted nucleotidyltransferase
MSSESSQRSISPSRPVDPAVVRVLRSLDPVAREVGCAYFVSGATARDLILVNVHGLRPGRATRDIDFGVAVESWGQFAGLKDALVATGYFASERFSGSSTPIRAQESPFRLISYHLVALRPPRAPLSGRQTVTSS